MCKQYIFLAYVLSVLCVVQCTPPELFRICKSDDSQCIKETTKTFVPLFVAGLPEYGVEVLDPLHIKSINASQGNLLFTLSEVTVLGLKNCEPKKVYRDKEKSKIFLQIQCTTTLDGAYVLKGSVLVVPVGGEGKIHVDFNSAVINLEIDTVNKVGEDGRTHWHIAKYQHNFDLKGKSNLAFEKLNKGNEVVGHAARDLIENHGNEVIKEIGSPVIGAVISKILKNVNHMFKAIPAEKLSID